MSYARNYHDRNCQIQVEFSRIFLQISKRQIFSTVECYFRKLDIYFYGREDADYIPLEIKVTSHKQKN